MLLAVERQPVSAPSFASTALSAGATIASATIASATIASASNWILTDQRQCGTDANASSVSTALSIAFSAAFSPYLLRCT